MRPLTVAAAIALASTTAARAQEAMPVATVSAIKDATIFIRTEADPEEHSVTGSGFLIRSEGGTGYIVTNDHVIRPKHQGDNATRPPTIKVVFRSGTKAESEATAEVVASAPERDLAVLKVTNVANLPKPVGLTTEGDPFETMTIYIFGFPFGHMLADRKGNPPVNVARGQVSSTRRDEDDRLTSVLVDGAINPGNSGGPVVDAKGRLVGVSVATIRGANIGFAIALPQLLDMLKGEVGGLNLTVQGRKAGVVELACEAPLLDPLDKVKSARLLYTLGAARFSRTKRERVAPEPDDEGNPLRPRPTLDPVFVYGPIEGAKDVPLTVARHKAVGTLSVPSAGKGVAVWCQAAYVDGTGKTVHARPVRHLLGESRADGLTHWGEVVDPDDDCDLKLEDWALVGDVPGTLHDLNIDIGKVNAPRVVRDVDGDFVVTVKVQGSFRPGEVRTGPKSVPYNGGGLLVWWNPNNYIRLERASMYRNGRVVGFLAVREPEARHPRGDPQQGGPRPHARPLAPAGTQGQRRLGLPQPRRQGLGRAGTDGRRLAVDAQGRRGPGELVRRPHDRPLHRLFALEGRQARGPRLTGEAGLSRVRKVMHAPEAIFVGSAVRTAPGQGPVRTAVPTGLDISASSSRASTSWLTVSTRRKS